ncbi:DUF1801 domain-containing protein [Paracoccus litorisediminis]|jgi:hypothetical protein|uniref:DUF1801 domain-containing protein n=1 Tax=Paracoccus litorisediminis TaxID=2006130 RepID=A0A844HLM7_9RHOB|nr:DUF1801 domain-containing protein [Paracoccus litorisediminis]MTH58562.1 DUF1801 domain-containing protein [Paracoccus litorisediminis]
MPDKKAAPVLLSGGNPQIAKGYGDAPVQDYIRAMPDWKQAVGWQIDRVITHTLPEIRKAVKWNSPLYGVEEGRWFLGLHCMAKYVKIGFFDGAELLPPPPIGSKQPKVRYLHVSEAEPLDEAQFADWVTQASKLPGEKL